MKFSKFIVIPIMIAVLAAILQVIDQSIPQLSFGEWGGFGWVSFQAWAMYFLSGCNVTGAIKTFIGYAVGCVASIAIIAFAGYLGGLGAGFWAVPLSLLILVVPVICLERVPWLDYVPAIFIGAGVFFGMMTYVQDATFCSAFGVEMLYCVIGLIFGYVTVKLRVAYEASVKK